MQNIKDMSSLEFSRFISSKDSPITLDDYLYFIDEIEHKVMIIEDLMMHIKNFAEKQGVENFFIIPVSSKAVKFVGNVSKLEYSLIEYNLHAELQKECNYANVKNLVIRQTKWNRKKSKIIDLNGKNMYYQNISEGESCCGILGIVYDDKLDDNMINKLSVIRRAVFGKFECSLMRAMDDRSPRFFNTSYFTRKQKEMNIAAFEQNVPLTLILGDLCALGYANDHYGHLVGDALLGICENIMLQELRGTDILARLGKADEYGAVLYDVSKKDAENIERRLKAQIQQKNSKPLEYKLKDSERSEVFPFLFAIGCSTLNPREDSINNSAANLYRAAERGYYQEKIDFYRKYPHLDKRREAARNAA